MEGKGLIQIYTGDGKGKTTAAIGQGIRACGRGCRVIMVQFLKTSDSGELEIIKKIDGFDVFRFQTQEGFYWNLDEAGRSRVEAETKAALEFAERVMADKKCDILILDEILGALSNGLVKLDSLIRLLGNKPEGMEVVLTGRGAPEELIEKADLVTQMQKVKHPLDKGIGARRGIEY
ncbi:Cob(I)yrinic acid a,c-diamide adenosyltransferase CobO [Peptoclostridium acidaminophilum DSM 3953]|uniref:Cob(I)yrinic acid a,c-diamide adenosyltransferase CobO n=1 Tax=Peptoclostridium acidaminophilum DSM 3953 TaxID=1286171 RepID=W8U820_PEPAC|nr:cob(I)yrinic acid a,c-diamide adenosyltransferase [Peptoclostridium acidaminophilum]AHM57026.1 Cob(I)yrinic acid a,c-diamide adenosyltransferase CobO [Peptoclostridium acidaminophilum DSM 3953]